VWITVPSDVVLSRLKREPVDTVRKRDTLRSLAFWFGHERAYLGPVWNYLTLIRLCHEDVKSVNIRDGVRIAISVSSRGDVVGNDIIEWLRREIRQYIRDGLKDVPFDNWGTVRTYDLNTLFVDFPMESDISIPSTFQHSIRNAVAVAHQIAVRWSLSSYRTSKRFLSIGIAAGEFSTLDQNLRTILNEKLPGDPVIRMSDYARQCILINDIRVDICPVHSEVILFNGEPLHVWWVVGLWSLIYWDFIPQLLEDGILKQDENARMSLSKLLWFPDGLTRADIETYQPNAVQAYLVRPHDTVLGIEIAKTLYYRRRFFEANEILRLVLSVYPHNFNARSFRMVIFRCLAAASTTYAEARIHFNRAEEEAVYIQSYCLGLNEDFFDEYAVIKLAHALMILRLMRGANAAGTIQEPMLSINAVKRLLDESENLFEKGLTVSPTGIRTLYLVTCVRILRQIILRDGERFIDQGLIAQSPDILTPASALFAAMGWARSEFKEKAGLEILFLILEKSFQIHQEAVALSSYRPTIFYCYAMALWDFYPVRTYMTARRVHDLLNEALSIADSVEKDGVCIYSYTRCHGEMMEPDLFKAHIRQSIDCVEQSAGGKERLMTGPDDEKIDLQNGSQPILFTINMMVPVTQPE
jgi:hypothetical protein